jgi:hypothetical protein
MVTLRQQTRAQGPERWHKMTFTNLINRVEAYMRSEIENNVAFIENGIEN